MLVLSSFSVVHWLTMSAFSDNYLLRKFSLLLTRYLIITSGYLGYT